MDQTLLNGLQETIVTLGKTVSNQDKLLSEINEICEKYWGDSFGFDEIQKLLREYREEA